MKTIIRMLAAAVVGGALALAGTGAAAATTVKEEATQLNHLTLRLAAHPDQVVNVKGGGSGESTPLIQYPLSGTKNELWEPESTLDGYYRFKGVESGKCINVQGGGNADGTPVIQYTCGNSPNELWKFVPVGIGYQIQAKSSGKCLNVQGGVGVGNALIQYACVSGGAPNDVWLPVWEPTR